MHDVHAVLAYYITDMGHHMLACLGLLHWARPAGPVESSEDRK